MSRGDALPDDNHVTRYCKWTVLDEDTGEPTGAAFMPVRGEDHLSVNWLEFFDEETQEEDVSAIREIFKTKGYRLGGKAKFAVLEVVAIKTGATSLQVLHWPIDPDDSKEPEDPSHSGIFGYPQGLAQRQLVADIIAEVVPAKTYPAKG